MAKLMTDALKDLLDGDSGYEAALPRLIEYFDDMDFGELMDTLDTWYRGTGIPAGILAPDSVTETEIAATSLATNSGLAGGSGTKFSIDLDDLAGGAVIDPAADSFSFIDATDATTKKEAISDFLALITGNGMAYGAGVIAVESDVTTGGNVVPIDVTANGIGLDVGDIDGNGLLADGSGNLDVDMDQLAAGVFDPTADDLVFIDATDAGSKQESADDFVTALSGDGIKNTASQFAIEPNDFAGTGLEDDGADNLRLATQGNGIAGGAGSTLSVDPDSTTGGTVIPVDVTANGVGVDVQDIAPAVVGAVVNVAADTVLIGDADDSGNTKQESIADLATAQAGTCIAAAAGVFSVDLNEAPGAIMDPAADSIAIIDAGSGNATSKEAWADVVSLTSGNGINGAAGVYSLDINELAGAVFDPATDSLPFLDSGDASSKVDLWTDIATSTTGNGLEHTAGVRAVKADSTTGGTVIPVDVTVNGVGVDVQDIGNALADVAIDMSADKLVFVDTGDGNKTVVESVPDFVTALASTGLTSAPTGTMSVNYDFGQNTVKFDGSGACSHSGGPTNKLTVDLSKGNKSWYLSSGETITTIDFVNPPVTAGDIVSFTLMIKNTSAITPVTMPAAEANYELASSAAVNFYGDLPGNIAVGNVTAIAFVYDVTAGNVFLSIGDDKGLLA